MGRLGPDGLPCPWNRGTVDTVACRESTGASGGANEVGHGSGLPTMGRLRCRVGWWGACGWWSGMPAPSGQIPPPWAWWENEAPVMRAACRPRLRPLAMGLARSRCPVALCARVLKRKSADAASASRQFGRASEPFNVSGRRAEGGMMEQQRPRVVLRGPGDGDAMVLTMGPHRAHITRKAARTETGGHWARHGKTPALTTLRTPTTRRRRSMWSKGATPSTPTLTLWRR